MPSLRLPLQAAGEAGSLHSANSALSETSSRLHEGRKRSPSPLAAGPGSEKGNCRLRPKAELTLSVGEVTAGGRELLRCTGSALKAAEAGAGANRGRSRADTVRAFGGELRAEQGRGANRNGEGLAREPPQAERGDDVMAAMFQLRAAMDCTTAQLHRDLLEGIAGRVVDADLHPRSPNAVAVARQDQVFAHFGLLDRG